MHYVYIVQCKDDTLYTGWTTDLNKRIAAHNAGIGAKYTRGRGPVKLVHSESFDSKPRALQREREIKQLTRAEKLQLIASGK